MVSLIITQHITQITTTTSIYKLIRLVTIYPEKRKHEICVCLVNFYKGQVISIVVFIFKKAQKYLVENYENLSVVYALLYKSLQD